MSKTEPDGRRATRGGPYVLAITGLAILALIGQGADSVPDYLMLGLTGLFLVWGSFRLARFVREHGAEIGEARFDTRNDK